MGVGRGGCNRCGWTLSSASWPCTAKSSTPMLLGSLKSRRGALEGVESDPAVVPTPPSGSAPSLRGLEVRRSMVSLFIEAG